LSFDDLFATVLSQMIELWRPRFSLRTLAVFVTLVCVYFAAWELTSRKGVAMIEAQARANERDDWWINYVSDVSSPLPFVVSYVAEPINHEGPEPMGPTWERRYCLWIFGWVWEFKNDAAPKN
jgi:hypothetical protein